ncbi:PREDICTED: acidic juvenile hormone-suppressible protein 1-like [Papilio xuthus]|uniref:Acidic juvenile hormone-suppressible protein 1-like n=1 Tax=Papilio xuthus TaxID=66420 RepID=A0AAJ6ZVF2_PAPXU|nr:PREDICTED: acidic juvenile hormone-suppressible protein 1-like [Papilio xuthus]
MARLVLCVLALLACGLADPVHKVQQKIADHEFLQHQVEVLNLFYHIHEPIHEPELQHWDQWDLIQNIEKYTNETAVKLYSELVKADLILPRGVPFSILEPTHLLEAKLLYNVLYSAKDFTTFYKTAVFVRNKVNEGLFVYVLSVVLLHHPGTQGIVIPPIYDIFPSYFHNAHVLTTAQRINTHGKQWIEHYPSTYVWDENVVIRWNDTVWPYFTDDYTLTYFTHDVNLNAYYYNHNLLYPYWLGGQETPLIKDRRGEFWWFLHKQIITRYYLERLSNGFGEIPVLDFNVVKQGYVPQISYHNGIPFPVRPNHFHLDQPEFVEAIEKIVDYEHRVREAIDRGYVINHVGEHINIHTPEAIDILGRLIEGGVDSPNPKYYKDFISIWKALLGNTLWHKQRYHNDLVALVVPSVLEHYQTALRDPAFYSIWKRVLGLFTAWQKTLPSYDVHQLTVPSVTIKSVEVDKLVTFFENVYLNVTNHLHLNEHESKAVADDVTVLVQRPQLNHKVFTVRVNVTSEVAKTVLVKFFLAPKYDSNGEEIPLHLNTENFYLLDIFPYDLPVGNVVIKRESTDNWLTIRNWTPGYEVYEKAYNALHGKGQFVLDRTHRLNGFPDHLLLPKGRVGGFPFVLLVHISEFRPSKIPQGSNYDPIVSYGLGSGARWLSDEPFGYPVDRPLYQWQADLVPNLHIEDVHIFHKHVPEVVVPQVV